LNRSLSVLYFDLAQYGESIEPSACSAGPLTRIGLAESSDASEPMFAYEDREVHGEEVGTVPEHLWRVEGHEADRRSRPGAD